MSMSLNVFNIKKAPRAETVAAFQAGDESAFAEIYTRYRKPIFRLVLQKIHDQETAEDLVQEIFLKVHRFRGSYCTDYAFSTWLWTIARNAIVDSKRRKVAELDGSMGSTAEEIPSQLPNAEVMLERVHEQRTLAKLLGRLTDLQRKVIQMRLVEQLSYQEIARRLDMSFSAVKCLAYRSRQALREMGYTPAFA